MAVAAVDPIRAVDRPAGRRPAVAERDGHRDAAGRRVQPGGERDPHQVGPTRPRAAGYFVRRRSSRWSCCRGSGGARGAAAGAVSDAATVAGTAARPRDDDPGFGFRRAARELARQLFRDFGLDPVGVPAGPSVHYRGTLVARWRLWWDWRAGWRLARVPPRVVTARQVPVDPASVGAVLAAVERGDIVLDGTNGRAFQQRIVA